MYEYAGGAFSIKVNLEPGLYLFDGNSSTGKTYLCKLLKQLRGRGEPVDGYTYADARRIGLREYLRGLDLPSQDIRVLLLDRYDMYAGQFCDVIAELREHCVVLLDCKLDHHLGTSDDGICEIILEEGRIEVSI